MIRLGNTARCDIFGWRPQGPRSWGLHGFVRGRARRIPYSLGSLRSLLAALPPHPRHFPLWANSMVEEQGNTHTTGTPPMPSYGCRTRIACRQILCLDATYLVLALSLIPRSSEFKSSQGHVVREGIPARHWRHSTSRRGEQASSFYHAIGPKRQMPGAWGQNPQSLTVPIPRVCRNRMNVDWT